HWEPEGDPKQGYAKGRMRFRLAGEKLRGHWALVRMQGRGEDQWLLIKGEDEFASDEDILSRAPVSALTERTLDEIQAADGEGGQASVDVPHRNGKATAGRGPKVAAKGSITKKKIPGARPGKPPAEFGPQLATLHKAVPTGDDWLHEIKYD